MSASDRKHMPRSPAWLALPEVKSLQAVFDAHGMEYLFAGDALRDAVANRYPETIGLVTTADAGRLLALAGTIDANATLVDRDAGTVHLRLGAPSRLFSLSCFDVAGLPQGRAEDHIESYLRRHANLTINALAMHPDGRWFDPLGGLEDIEQGVIRLTDAGLETLPRRPALLINLLRFHALYGKRPLPVETTRACRRHAHRLKQVEGRYMTGPLLKWLAVPGLSASLQLARRLNLFAGLFPFAMQEQTALRRLEEAEAKQNLPPDVEIRLALCMQTSELPAQMALDIFMRRWPLPSACYAQIRHLLLWFPQLRQHVAMQAGRPMRELFGRQLAAQLTLLHWANEPPALRVADRYRKLLAEIYEA